LLLYLPGTTPFGIGLAASIGLFVGTISIILFGYYSDILSERFSRKNPGNLFQMLRSLMIQ
jgi:hypothetical protein